MGGCTGGVQREREEWCRVKSENGQYFGKIG